MLPCKHQSRQANCRICELYHSDERYRKLWSDHTPKQCAHLGSPTGETVLCPSCRGKVELKVFECQIHQRCTTGRKGGGLACCQGCPDYASPPRKPWNMLLTGGIGDVFAVESLLSPEERESLETVYYACPASAEIVQLMQALEGTSHYPALSHHVILPTGQKTCYSAAEVETVTGELPDQFVDCSIRQVFPSGRKYSGSTWLNLPIRFPRVEAARYAVIVPGSDWGYSPNRSFDDADWKACLQTLDQYDLVGIVLRKTPHPLPRSPRLWDWQGKTSILQSVEILRQSQGYLGIDSCLSVLAAKLLRASRMSIKSVRDHLKLNREIYYAPRTEFGFVAPQLKVPSWQ